MTNLIKYVLTGKQHKNINYKPEIKNITNFKPYFDYQAFHPSFYHYWQILNELKIESSSPLFLVDNDDLGGLEAYLHYRETNVDNYLEDKYILAPIKPIDINERFRSVYRFLIHKFDEIQAIKNYYQKTPFDLIIADMGQISSELICYCQRKDGTLILKTGVTEIEELNKLISHYQTCHLIATDNTFFLFILQGFKLKLTLIDVTSELLYSLKKLKKMPEMNVNNWAEKYNLKLAQNVLPEITYNMKLYKFKTKCEINFGKENWPDNMTLQRIKRQLNQTKRAIDTKNVNLWNEITDRIDMFRELKHQLKKMNAYITNPWMKFYEILSKFKLIKKSKKELRSLHLYDNNSINSLKDLLKTRNTKLYAETNPNNKYDLIIADGALTVPINMYNEQELYIENLLVEEMIIILKYMKKDNNCIIKIFLPMAEHKTIICLYILRCLFKNLILCKPMTSHPSSSEVYVVCSNFQDSQYKNAIIKQLQEDINKLIIPNEFLQELLFASNYFVNLQIMSIYRSFFYYNTGVPNLQPEKELLAENWLKKHKLSVNRHETQYI